MQHHHRRSESEINQPSTAQRENQAPNQQQIPSRRSGYVNSGAETEVDANSQSIKRKQRRQRFVKLNFFILFYFLYIAMHWSFFRIQCNSIVKFRPFPYEYVLLLIISLNSLSVTRTGISCTIARKRLGLNVQTMVHYMHSSMLMLALGSRLLMCSL